ncbi:hypothetical protein BO443_10846 [Burkholderia orbicola]
MGRWTWAAGSNCTEGYRADCTVTVPVATITVDWNGDRAAAVPALPHVAQCTPRRLASGAPAGAAPARHAVRLP